MSHRIYKHIQLIGSSPGSIDDAVRKAIERARQTVKNMRWYQISTRAVTSRMPG